MGWSGKLRKGVRVHNERKRGYRRYSCCTRHAISPSRDIFIRNVRYIIQFLGKNPYGNKYGMRLDLLPLLLEEFLRRMVRMWGIRSTRETNWKLVTVFQVLYLRVVGNGWVDPMGIWTHKEFMAGELLLGIAYALHYGSYEIKYRFSYNWSRILKTYVRVCVYVNWQTRPTNGNVHSIILSLHSD